MSLTSESEALSRLVGDIYDAALDPNKWQEALGHACAFVGGSSAALFWHDAASERSAVLHEYNGNAHYTRLYFEKYLKLNPVFPAAAFMETGVVHSATDIIPQEELAKTRFYKEWIEPQGMTDTLAATLERGITRAAILNLRWFASDTPMDEGARHRLSLIVPHFQRAVAIGRLFDQTKASEDAFAETLDHVEAGVFLIGSGARIVHTNAAGRHMLDEATLLRESRQSLVAVAPDTNRILRDIFVAADKGDTSLGVRGVAVPLAYGSDNEWFAHVLPLTSGDRRRTGSTYAAIAAMFVRKASQEAPSPLEAIARRYTLTASEVRVLDAVMQVSGVREIADLIGISQATVKTHLRHLYRKTETRRQSDLVKIVAGIGRATA